MSTIVHYEVSDAEEQAVADAIKRFRQPIEETPELTSLLYDIDLLPEQVVHMANANRMAAVCRLYFMVPVPSPETLLACKSDHCQWPKCRLQCHDREREKKMVPVG